MQFRLTYTGELRPRQKGGLPSVHQIRMALHPQLKTLWSLDPLCQLTESESSHRFLAGADQKRAGFNFRPVICKAFNIVAHLDVLFLRGHSPGDIVTRGGDIDNRLKSLLDALRVPSAAEVTTLTISDPPDPIYCLLEDDALLTKVAFEADRHLGNSKPFDALIVMQVDIKRSRAMAMNDIFL